MLPLSVGSFEYVSELDGFSEGVAEGLEVIDHVLDAENEKDWVRDRVAVGAMELDWVPLAVRL